MPAFDRRGANFGKDFFDRKEVYETIRQVQLLDLMGLLIAEGPEFLESEEWIWDLSSLNRGTYLLSYELRGKRQIERVVLE